MSKICKKRANYRRHRGFLKGRYGIILLIFLFFALITGYFFLYTDFFAIREIVVHGNDYIEEKEIIKLSHIDLGMNIFMLNKSNVEDKIRRHSFVKEASVSLELPDRIILTIQERDLSCIIPFEDGIFIYIDEEGVVLEKSQVLKSYNYPLITGLEDVSFLVGKTIDITPSWLKNALLSIVILLEKNQLSQHISEIHVLEDYSIQLYTKSGSVIIVGDDAILEKKINFVKTFVSQELPNSIVDISHGGDPVSKPRNN